MRCARLGDLDPATLYGIMRLRVDVFVVEQGCSYADLDGRDTEPDTRHCWASDDGEVVACLRLLREDGGWWRIGRVATRPAARGGGLAAALVGHALELAHGPVVIEAQAQLEAWYGRFGFTRSGAPYMVDGLMHVTMTRG